MSKSLLERMKVFYPEATSMTGRFRQQDGSLGHPVTLYSPRPGGGWWSERKAQIEVLRLEMTTASASYRTRPPL